MLRLKNGVTMIVEEAEIEETTAEGKKKVIGFVRNVVMIISHGEINATVVKLQNHLEEATEEEIEEVSAEAEIEDLNDVMIEGGIEEVSAEAEIEDLRDVMTEAITEVEIEDLRDVMTEAITEVEGEINVLAVVEIKKQEDGGRKVKAVATLVTPSERAETLHA